MKMKLHNLRVGKQFLRNRTFRQNLTPQGSKIVGKQYEKVPTKYLLLPV